jgi:beta-lactamase class A
MLVVVASAILPAINHRWVAASRQESTLRGKIEQLIVESGAQTVALSYHDLQTGAQLMINPDESFHAASTMKVPVMMEVFRQSEAGRLSLEDRIRIKNSFVSIADGSTYSLNRDSDSEHSLYERVGKSQSVRHLLRLMIGESSNLATNLLIEQVTADKVMSLLQKIGANETRVLRGVEDGKAFQKGLNNVTTARDLMTILQLIATKRAVSRRASEEMLRILSDQTFSEGIPAGLPTGMLVAHKTGSITRIYHDAGIVYPAGRQPYVLVVLTRGIQDQNRAHRLVADISKTIYAQL